jgi:intracellular septation protein
MKFIDMIPVVAFFVTSKVFDFFTATAVFMGLLVALAAYYWIKDRKPPKGHIAVAILGCVLGAATLYYHNISFLQYKLTVINWCFGLALLFSQFVGEKVLAQRAGEAVLTLPEPVWRKINLAWALFFFTVGALNLLAIKYLSEAAWVNFKAGTIGMSFAFTLAHIPFLKKYLPEE